MKRAGTRVLRDATAHVVIVAAFVLAALPIAALGPAVAGVAAATPSLTLVADTTYQVVPAEHRVAVTSRITATNHLKDTATRRFFFRTAYLSVLPGTTGFALGGGSGTPRVSVQSKTATATVIKLDLGANLAAGKSTTLQLRFDVVDPGGAPDRPVRISPSLVTFDAWALATPNTQGSTVTVSVPTGYHVAIGRGPLTGPTTIGGQQTWTSGKLAKPLEFVADVSADKPSAWQETQSSVTMAAGTVPVTIRAWPDDAAWRDRVSGLVAKALPLLEREIGVPWPVQGQLSVQEALARGTDAVGTFDPATSEIEVGYAATDEQVLHELAHAWFNGRLVADRWAAEGFATYYAREVLSQLDPTAAIGGDAPDPNTVPPLNSWAPAAAGASGPASAASGATFEAAAAEAATEIANRAGAEALRAVWSRASHGLGAYDPRPGSADAGSEAAPGVPDWRGLLDLFEEVAGADFGDIWATWVLRPEDVALVGQRAAARTAYASAQLAAGDWTLPRSIRDALRSWRFDEASAQIDVAKTILGQRDELDREAASAGVTPPSNLRTAFEGDAGLAGASSEATAELTTLEQIDRAAAAKPPDEGPAASIVRAIGLFPADPGERIAAAKAAFSRGDLETAYGAAADAEAAWRDAADVGRTRIVSAGLLALALVLFAALLRQRRRQPKAEAA